MRACCRLVLLLFLSACAWPPLGGAQAGSKLFGEEALPPGLIQVIIGEEWFGVSLCGSKPTYWINGTTTPDSLRGMVEAHERDHVAYMREFPSCEAFHAAVTRVEERRLDLEARGFCAGARYEFQRGKHPSLMEAVWVQANYLRWYKWGMTREDAASRIWRHCGGA